MAKFFLFPSEQFLWLYLGRPEDVGASESSEEYFTEELFDTGHTWTGTFYFSWKTNKSL